MSGHRPDGTLSPYDTSNRPVHCECGAEIQFDGDYSESLWTPVTGDTDRPCPVWDDECPAGGAHTPTSDITDAQLLTGIRPSNGEHWWCEECHADLGTTHGRSEP